jgi:ketosteroid isomerase-like protein
MATMAPTALLTEQDIASLTGVIDKHTDLIRRADWDGLTKLLHDEVVFLPPNEPAVKGKAAVRKWLGAFPRITAMTSTPVQFDGHEDLAWVRGKFEMTTEVERNKPVKMVGKWAATFRMQPDRTWLCLSDTWNSDKPM